MIVAGIGCRRGVAAEAVVTAVHAALTAQGIGIASVDALATVAHKENEYGIRDAARVLAVDLIVVDDISAREASARALTVSERSAETTGLASVSEAAALAAAGSNSRLLAPRLVSGAVTCALAISGDAA